MDNKYSSRCSALKSCSWTSVEGRSQRSTKEVEQRYHKNTAKLRTDPSREVIHIKQLSPWAKLGPEYTYSLTFAWLLRLCAAQSVPSVQAEPERPRNDSGAAWPAHTRLAMTQASTTGSTMLVVSNLFVLFLWGLRQPPRRPGGRQFLD